MKNEKEQISYTQIGDYLYPNLKMPNQDIKLTRYGLKKREFLKKYRPNELEMRMVAQGENQLNKYLENIQIQAEEAHKRILERKIKETESKGLMPERNKQPMEWATMMMSLEAETMSMVEREYISNQEPEKDRI